MMEERPPASRERIRGWPRYEGADLGFRHYWYPVLEARKLRNKPHALTVLGEKIVLVRDGEKIRALNDRCQHRGVPLSAGKREFPGTLTCRYHGWTYDLKTGELVAALTDGPKSPICHHAKVAVKTYPAEERANLIWVYIGDEPHPPVEQDIPEQLLAPDSVVEPMVELRKGDWRYAMENAVDEAHAKYLHRHAAFYILYQMAGYQNDIRMVPSEDGRWLRRFSTPVFEQGDYPGLGKWPPRESWRILRRSTTERAVEHPVLCAASLPSTMWVGHADWEDFQIFVPVDREHHLTLQVSMKRTRGLGKLLWRLRFWCYIRYLHHGLLNREQDGWMVTLMDSPPEQLFRPDIAIVAWRRWCNDRARRSPTEATASLDTAAASEFRKTHEQDELVLSR
jgi:phenylpropionate dioxygenase-like ring-hydroxylating dioxygenase large terminal subunit